MSKEEVPNGGLVPDNGSSQPPRDLEKGDSGSKDWSEDGTATVDARPLSPETDIVGWDGSDDPDNPENWSTVKKSMVTCFYAALTFCLTFASSVFSTATVVTSKLYGVSTEVMTLGTSLFVLVCSLP